MRVQCYRQRARLAGRRKRRAERWQKPTSKPRPHWVSGWLARLDQQKVPFPCCICSKTA